MSDDQNKCFLEVRGLAVELHERRRRRVPSPSTPKAPPPSPIELDTSPAYRGFLFEVQRELRASVSTDDDLGQSDSR